MVLAKSAMLHQSVLTTWHPTNRPNKGVALAKLRGIVAYLILINKNLLRSMEAA